MKNPNGHAVEDSEFARDCERDDARKEPAIIEQYYDIECNLGGRPEKIVILVRTEIELAQPTEVK